jgi:hypothetical protein
MLFFKALLPLRTQQIEELLQNRADKVIFDSCRSLLVHDVKQLAYAASAIWSDIATANDFCYVFHNSSPHKCTSARPKMKGVQLYGRQCAKAAQSKWIV